MLRWAVMMGLMVLSRGSDPAQLIQDLGSDDIQVRDRAFTKLLRKGREARPFLEKACGSSDPEVRDRARFILRSTYPLQIEFEFDPQRADANRSLTMSIGLKNELDQEAVFFAGGLSSRIALLELFEEPQKAGPVYGGRAPRKAGCPLSEEEFVRVPSGGTFTQPHGVGGREIEVEAKLRKDYPKISFWAISTAGRYRAVASYRYDPVTYKSRCNLGCPDHDDPRKLWNLCSGQALETARDFTVAAGVRPSPWDSH